MFAEEDRAFHMTIFKNVGNALTEQLLTALWTLLNSQIATRHPDLEAVAAQHEDILRALVRQDLDEKQKSTSEQLADVRYRIMMGMLQNSESLRADYILCTTAKEPPSEICRRGVSIERELL